MSLDLRLAVTDLVVGDVPIKIKCPDRIHKERLGGKADKTNSLAVYPDSIHCYGCDFDRSQEWALAELLGVPLGEARELLSRYDSDSLDAYRERAAEQAGKDPLPTALAEVYHAVLVRGPRRVRWEWLYARGLTDETIARARIGHDGNRFVIPVFSAGGDLLSLRFRRDDEYLDEKYPKYCGTKGRNGLYLYPEPLIEAAYPLDYLVVCEGELDALRLWQAGIPAITATNGAGQARKLPAMIRERWPRVRHLLVATDMDEPGAEAARLVAQAAHHEGMTAGTLTWAVGKDITEAMQLGTITREDILGHIG